MNYHHKEWYILVGRGIVSNISLTMEHHVIPRHLRLLAINLPESWDTLLNLGLNGWYTAYDIDDPGSKPMMTPTTFKLWLLSSSLTEITLPGSSI